MTTVKRKNRDGSISTVSCPYIVDQYNRHMGGVDFTDQLKVYYGYNRKSKHWWLRLFSFFRYCCQCICSVSALLSTQLASSNEIQDEKTSGISVWTHRQPCQPLHLPQTQRSSHNTSCFAYTSWAQDIRSLGVRPGRCEFCTVEPYKTRKRKETQFGCSKCQKRLFPTECWAKYHNKLQPQWIEHLSLVTIIIFLHLNGCSDNTAYLTLLPWFYSDFRK